MKRQIYCGYIYKPYLSEYFSSVVKHTVYEKSPRYHKYFLPSHYKILLDQIRLGTFFKNIQVVSKYLAHYADSIVYNSLSYPNY